MNRQHTHKAEVTPHTYHPPIIQFSAWGRSFIGGGSPTPSLPIFYNYHKYGHYEYTGDRFTRINTSAGYRDSKGTHVYVRDWQGNVRAVVSLAADGSTLLDQTTYYYPYGLPMAESTSPQANPYKYTAKELLTDQALNIFDYGARFYDPTTALWLRRDDLSFNTPEISHFAFCNGDPINYIDPSGLSIQGVSKRDAAMAVEDLRAMFPGDTFSKFRDLIVQSGKNQNGKTLSTISSTDLTSAFDGTTLTADQQALVDLVVNTINSEDKHIVEYFTTDAGLSSKGYDIISAKFNGLGLSSEYNSESSKNLAQIVYNLCGEGSTTNIRKGSYSLVLKADIGHITNRAGTLGHEVLGHGRAITLGLTDSQSQHIIPIQVENLIMRVMGVNIYRTGTHHGPLQTFIPNYNALPYR